MNDEIYYTQKHLQITQKKIETLENKKDMSKTSYDLEQICNELRVLRSIEDFLWKKL